MVASQWVQHCPAVMNFLKPHEKHECRSQIGGMRLFYQDKSLTDWKNTFFTMCLYLNLLRCSARCPSIQWDIPDPSWEIHPQHTCDHCVEGLIHFKRYNTLPVVVFKLLPCLECSLCSFGNFPGVWSIKADISELNVGSIVLGDQE